MPTINLDLCFLGPARIAIDGKTISVDTRKATALLAYLAITGESHTRDALATLLYPEYEASRGRAALRRTLSALNKATGSTLLEADRSSIGLNPDANIELDVQKFSALVERTRKHIHQSVELKCVDCIGWLTEAVALYRGDFLEGFSLRDSVNFDDWQFFQSEQVRHELGWALEHLMQSLINNGEIEAAIPHARRWLALDPLHEPAHQQLMKLYAWSGQQAAAIRQYQECIRILDEELGVQPLKETDQLYEAIKNHRLPPPLQPEVPPRQTLPASDQAPSLDREPLATTELPLVGRTSELANLINAYDNIEESGQFFVLRGEAGIGKSRLAHEFLLRVQSKQGVIMSAQCYEGETRLAYGPIREAARQALSLKDNTERLASLPTYALVEATRLFPEILQYFPELPAASPLDALGAQSRFFEGLSQVLLALVKGQKPGVLFLDDVQWADDASLDLLTYLVRRLIHQPWCIFVTWRTEHVTADHNLQRLLADARRAGVGTSIEMTRLSPHDVADVTRLARGGSEIEALSEQLYRETEGLPFFVAEYINLLMQHPEVDPNSLPVPESVYDLLHARLSVLSETGRQVLTAAAVIGRSFDFDTVREASGRGELETIQALEELTLAGLIVERKSFEYAAGPEYDFNHEHLRSLVYGETSLARRRLLHRRTAETIVQTVRGRDTARLAGQIASHYQLAGDIQEAAGYFKLAGDHARGLYANADALAHYRTALQLGYAQPAVLYEAIGDLLTLSGNYQAALAAYETAAASTERQTLQHLEHKLGGVYQRLGDWHLAQMHYQAALDDASDSAFRARVYADLSLIAHNRGEDVNATKLAEQAIELATDSSESRALAQANNILGILATSSGDLDTACDLLERSLTLAEQMNDPSVRIAALNNLALVQDANGNWQRAYNLTRQALALCIELGDRHHQAALHNHLADLLHARGREAEAMEQLKQAVRLFAEVSDEGAGFKPEIWKLTVW